MATEEADPFAYLEELVSIPGGGPHLNDLFGEKNVKQAAKLFLKDEARFERIALKLKPWGSYATWRKRVIDLAKQSVVDKAKEVRNEKLETALDKARDRGRPVLNQGRPVETAKIFAATKRPHVLFWDGQWLDWRNGVYVALEDGAIAMEVQRFMDSAVDFETAEPFIIGAREVDHVVSALKNVAFQHAGAESRLTLPMWLCPLGYEPPARYTVALKNGLLGVLDGQFMPHSADFFTRNILEFDYDPKAKCPQFMAFIESVWPDKDGLADNRRLLQEIFGYLVSGLTHHQKFFVFSGVGGGGKGVLIGLAAQLVGERNTAPYTFENLFGEGEARFAKEDLFDKTLVVFGDVVMSRHHIEKARQFILSTVGQDKQSSDRKNKSRIKGTLPVRLLMGTNKDMRIPDQSGEIRRRLVPMRFLKVFGNTPLEIPHLAENLKEELPGIFNWALEGLRRLEERGSFLLSEDSLQMLDHITLLSAPVVSFFNMVVERDDISDVTVTKLWNTFKGWTIAKLGEETYIPDIAKFRDAFETVCHFHAKRRGDDVRQPMVFDGLRLKPEYVDVKWPQTVDDYGDDED